MIITKSVGELITYVDERNTEGLISDFYGIKKSLCPRWRPPMA